MFEKLKKKLYDQKVKKIIQDSGILISKEEADRMREGKVENDLKLTEIDIFYNSMRNVFYKYNSKENEELLTNIFWDLDKEVEELKKRIK